MYKRRLRNSELNNTLLVLPPVPTTGLTAEDVNDLAVRVRAQMFDALFELSGLERKEPREETIENLEKSHKAESRGMSWLYEQVIKEDERNVGRGAQHERNAGTGRGRVDSSSSSDNE